MGSPASNGPSGGAQLQLSRKATGGRALVIGPRQCPLEHGLGDWSGRPTTWSGYGLPPDHQFTRRTSQPINDPHFTLTVTTFRARTCSLAELEDHTGHPDAAADTLEWVIDLDRYAEEPYRRLMALHAAHGRIDAVTATWKLLHQRLGDLDLEVEPATTRLYRSLKISDADTPDAGRAPRRGLQVGQRPSCASSVSARSVRPRQGDPASLLNKPLRGRRRPQTVPAGTTQWIHAPLLSHTPASIRCRPADLDGP